MNIAPRLALRKIIAKYGNDLAGDRRRVEGLLKDLCGEYRREINVLTNAHEERIPLDLLAANDSTPLEVLLTRLAKRLEDNLGLTADAANWAVDSWALALGVLDDHEVEAKEKKQDEILPTQTNPIQPSSPQNNKTVPPRNVPPTAQHQSQKPPQTLPNKPQPKNYPPVARPPVNLPTPAPKSQPPQRRQPGNSAINFPPQNPAQTSNQIQNTAQNAVPKKRFGKFFGCLFALFLLAITAIILLFGVPYAIETMRETQRTAPRRLPGQ